MTNPTSKTDIVDYLGEYYTKFDKNVSECRRVLILLEIFRKTNPEHFFIQESIDIVRKFIKENEPYIDDEFKKRKNQFF